MLRNIKEIMHNERSSQFMTIGLESRENSEPPDCDHGITWSQKIMKGHTESNSNLKSELWK
jgi:hypothetical protein